MPHYSPNECRYILFCINNRSNLRFYLSFRTLTEPFSKIPLCTCICCKSRLNDIGKITQRLAMHMGLHVPAFNKDTKTII